MALEHELIVGDVPDALGFTGHVDEPLRSLGQALVLAPRYEPRRAQLERALTPIVHPRQAPS